MKLKIKIEFGNEAMSNLHDAGRSLDWLSRNLKNLHEQGYDLDDPVGGFMMDDNGNTVGSWDIEDESSD